ncbi:MAG: hypothetical protein AAF722_03640 [Cyanobacteria bacterium P01_C01_bin.70]
MFWSAQSPTAHRWLSFSICCDVDGDLKERKQLRKTDPPLMGQGRLPGEQFFLGIWSIDMGRTIAAGYG